MSLLEVIFIGVGLSMDAVAVSMSNAMVFKSLSKKKLLAMPLFFGIFQGLMPLIGYFAGGIFADIITQYSNLLIFLILGFIGGKMIKDSFHKDENENTESHFTYKLLFMQAIATSIDAFAIGIGFSAVGTNIFTAAPIIALTTFVCSLFALFAGKKFGDLLKNKAELLGGIILVVIAINAIM